MSPTDAFVATFGAGVVVFVVIVVALTAYVYVRDWIIHRRGEGEQP